MPITKSSQVLHKNIKMYMQDLCVLTFSMQSNIKIQYTYIHVGKQECDHEDDITQNLRGKK